MELQARPPSSARPARLGVLTFHRCINYGSYWQARCLVEGLRAMGHDAVLLDHDSSRVTFREWRCALRPVLPTPVPPADRKLYAAKVRKFLEALEALPLSERFSLERPQEMAFFDCVVVGSDEVWNLAHPWYGHKPIFYGEGLCTARLVAYAASFGHQSWVQGLPAAWADRLRRFDVIAVRDGNSAALVARSLGKEAARVLDPCLQFAPSGGSMATDMTSPRGYIAVYGHNFSAGFCERLLAHARRHSLRVLSIGYRNDWADAQWLSAGPEDFATAMAGARAVATNFFHGCVFALRHGRALLCESSPYRAIKIDDLLSSLDARHHLLDADTPRAHWDGLLAGPLSEAIGHRIVAARAASEAWLRTALDGSPAGRPESADVAQGAAP